MTFLPPPPPPPLLPPPPFLVRTIVHGQEKKGEARKGKVEALSPPHPLTFLDAAFRDQMRKCPFLSSSPRFRLRPHCERCTVEEIPHLCTVHKCVVGWVHVTELYMNLHVQSIHRKFSEKKELLPHTSGPCQCVGLNKASLEPPHRPIHPTIHP